MVDPAILTSLGWLVSPLMKMLLEKGLNHLGVNIDKKLEILTACGIPRISLAIEAAEKSPNKDRLALWLQRLKNAYYEAEEAIDLLEYELLKRKVMDERKKMKNRRNTGVSFPFRILHRRLKFSSRKLGHYMPFFSPKKVMLRDCIDKLIEIAKEVNDYKDLLIQRDDVEPDRETTGVPPVRVFGREKDKENIVKRLMDKPNFSEPGTSKLPGIPIIAITGHPGVGKTTLAQYVNEHMKEQKYFDLSMWVHVPRKFRAVDVIKKMLSNISKKRSSLSDTQGAESEQINSLFEILQSSSNDSSLEALRLQINNKLGAKMFLLVLDDFRCDTEEDVEQWEKLMGCLNNWLQGSKILITTQSLLTARQIVVAEANIYELKQLEEDQFFQLLMHYALPMSYPIQENEFGNIGRKIALKLKGDPNAAKILGSLMRKKPDINHWREISEKDCLGDNMKARIWSYQQLSGDLQRCFAFCSLFPKGFRFDPEFLIHLWMAEGFIKTAGNDKRIEDIGRNYLDELVDKFFVEKHKDRADEYYFLHDLLHDLAERVVGDDCIRIDSEDNSKEIPERNKRVLFEGKSIRHLSLKASMINKLQNEICKQKYLRTLIVFGNESIPTDQLVKIFNELYKLRVLFLQRYNIEYLPDYIGNLKHLRYLNIMQCPLKKLPNSICQLYHLQVLALLTCESIPKKFSEIISLRHFIIDGETQSKVSDVGRLIYLQHLTEFHVRDKDGHEIQQLKDLAELRGKLCIKGLENVKSKEDAIQARLGQKSDLFNLELVWNSDSDKRTSDDAEIIDALQPHPNVRGITIKWFKGKRLPNWLVSQNSGKHVEGLTLWQCAGVEELSSIEQSLPNCKGLFLSGFNSLKEFPRLPPNIDSAFIELPLFLNFVCINDLQMKEEIKRSTMQVAEHLAVRYWSSLSEVLFPDDLSIITSCLLSNAQRTIAAPEISTNSSNWIILLARLLGSNASTTLDVVNLWVMSMNFQLDTMLYTDVHAKLILPSSLTTFTLAKGNITNQAFSMCIQNLELLMELNLFGIMTITSLPSYQTLQKLKHLQSLKILSCYLLTSLGGIHALTSMRKLHICGCPELNTSDVLLPSSLKKLTIKKCGDIYVMIERSELPNLEALRIWYSSIKKIDFTHLSSLKNFRIVECPILFSLHGLSSLSELDRLAILGCPRLELCSPVDKCSSLIGAIAVSNPLMLELILSNQTISKLKVLYIATFHGDYIAEEVLQPFTMLESLTFHSCQIMSLPKTIMDLGSLQNLDIIDCPNLGKLTTLPESLRSIKIEGCPILNNRCQRNGPDWHKIAHIPYKSIIW